MLVLMVMQIVTVMMQKMMRLTLTGPVTEV